MLNPNVAKKLSPDLVVVLEMPQKEDDDEDEDEGDDDWRFLAFTFCEVYRRCQKTTFEP